MKFIFLFPIFLIGSFFVSAQKIQLVQTNQSFQELNQKFKKYQVISLDTKEFNNQINQRSSSQKQLEFIGAGLDLQFQLIEYSLYKPEFIRRIGIDKDRVEQNSNKSEIKTYRVFQSDEPNHYSALTVSNDFIYGYFLKNGRKFFIEPLSYFVEITLANQFVIYSELDVIPIKNVQCGSEELKSQEHLANGSTNNLRAGCITVDVALAADQTIHDNKGGVGNSEAFMIGVLNNVQTNYDDEFAIAIEFSVSALFVATNSASDPWNGILNINTHLDKHRTWANSGGYGGSSYAVATAWSRKYTSGAIGVAWVGAVCSGLRYNVCSDFGGSAGPLRVLQAHELGHNFNALHDGAGSGFIMAPSVNNSTTWSSASISAITAFANSLGCVGICNGGEPPTAEFEGSPVAICPNNLVAFKDLSFGFPNKWTWILPGATPNSSNQQHPSVYYKQSGEYDVTLTISNAFGSNSVTKKMYIEVLPSVINSYLAYTIGNKLITTNSCIDADTYLWKFGDGKTSTEEEPTYVYSKDGTYNVELCATNSCGVICKTTKVIVVTPLVSDFKAERESGCVNHVVKFRNLSSSNASAFNWSFPGGTPSSSTEKEPIVSYSIKGKYEVILKVSNSKFDSVKTIKEYIIAESKPLTEFDLQLKDHHQLELSNLTPESILSSKNKYEWKFGDNSISKEVSPIHVYKEPGKYNVCLVAENQCGATELCKNIELANVLVPEFDTKEKDICAPFNVVFENKSFGIADYLWEFPGAEPSTSQDKNPVVKYSKAGRYDVSLMMKNATDQNIIKKHLFIYVKSPVQCPNRGGKNNILENDGDENDLIERVNSNSIMEMIFPNPSKTNQFIIQSPNELSYSTCQIENSNGMRIDFQWQKVNKFQWLIEILSANKGVYFVVLSDVNNRKVIHKLILI